MTQLKNPFLDLYVTENVVSDDFAKIFSPVILEESETHTIFQPGNVIITGLQGTGKSALLNLLKPESLISYLNLGIDWPLPTHCSRFLSAGINILKSSAMDFGQRRMISNLSEEDISTVQALHFADFLNYWVAYDLCASIEKFEHKRALSKETEIGYSSV